MNVVLVAVERQAYVEVPYDGRLRSIRIAGGQDGRVRDRKIEQLIAGARIILIRRPADVVTLGDLHGVPLNKGVLANEAINLTLETYSPVAVRLLFMFDRVPSAEQKHEQRAAHVCGIGERVHAIASAVCPVCKRKRFEVKS